MAINDSQSGYQATWGTANRKHRSRDLWHYFRLLLFSLILAFAIKESVVEAYRIPSESMENTLLVGDFLMANKLVYGAYVPFTNIRLPAVHAPRIGEVVVFRFPEDRRVNLIKRIIAAGGDTVEIVNKTLFVNHNVIDDAAYAVHFDQIVMPRSSNQPRDNFGPIIVPPDQYFMLGDNRDNSSDSRYWGCVPKNLIIAKASFIHWSWAPDAQAPPVTMTKPLSLLKSMGYNVRHLSSRVRWGRVFSVVS